MDVQGGVEAVEVYADATALLNFAVDFFILWIAGRLAGLAINPLRLVLGALVGAAYSLAVFFPENTVAVSLMAKIACSLVVVLIAFAPVSFARFIRSVFLMYALSFIIGGTVIGAVFLSGNGAGFRVVQVRNGVAVLADPLNLSWLLAGLGMAFLTGYAGFFMFRRNWLQQNLVCGLTVCIGDRRTDLDALLDTGNQLLDPLTGNPVVIVEANALKGMLPEELLEVPGNDDGLNLAALSERLGQEWAARLRVIPYNSVGRERGLLVGLRPDSIEIRRGNRVSTCRQAVIGLAEGRLAREGRYRALLNPLLWEKTDKCI